MLMRPTATLAEEPTTLSSLHSLRRVRSRWAVISSTSCCRVVGRLRNSSVVRTASSMSSSRMCRPLSRCHPRLVAPRRMPVVSLGTTRTPESAWSPASRIIHWKGLTCWASAGVTLYLRQSKTKSWMKPPSSAWARSGMVRSGWWYSECSQARAGTFVRETLPVEMLAQKSETRRALGRTQPSPTTAMASIQVLSVGRVDPREGDVGKELGRAGRSYHGSRGVADVA